MHYTLTAPNGSTIAASSDRRVVEDAFARTIEHDGWPHGVYTMRVHWTADGRWGAKGAALSRIVLGCDSGGWWTPDDSGVPSTAGAARRLGE